jgi:hypothetical protein
MKAKLEIKEFLKAIRDFRAASRKIDVYCCGSE